MDGSEGNGNGAKGNGTVNKGHAKRGLSISGAATFLGVSERAVWRLIENGILKKVVLPNTRRVLLDVNDLNNLFTMSKE